MLKYLFTICITVLLTSDSKERTWNATYKLSWSDFKAKPDYNSDAVAVTASGITFGYSLKRINKKVVDFETKVEAYFYPQHSWCKLDLADDHILSHEQLHFDITELHARNFRKLLTKVKANQNTAKTLQTLHQRVETDLAAMQNKYDTESNYSIHKEEQAAWQAFVTAELLKLKAYKSK